MTAALPRDPYLHLPPIGSERALTCWGQEVTMATCTAQWGGCRGLAVGLSSCPGHSRLVAVSRPPAEGAALWAMEGEAGCVIHAGSPWPAQRPLPCAAQNAENG